LSNSECRADSVIGQFVSDRTLCITPSEKFTCEVSRPKCFSSLKFHFSTC
jgi:hypothetical protein